MDMGLIERPAPGNIGEVAYKWINYNIPAGSTIVMLGGAASAQVLKENYNMHVVDYVEHFNGFQHGVHAIVTRFTKRDKPFIRFPFQPGWYDVKDVKDGLPKKYDLIVIDGPPMCRGGFYENINLFRDDVPIVIDDVQDYQTKLLLEFTAQKLRRPFAVLLDGDFKVGVILNKV